MALQTMIMLRDANDGQNYFTGPPLSLVPRAGEVISVDKGQPLRVIRVEHSILLNAEQHIIVIYVEPVEQKEFSTVEAHASGNSRHRGSSI